jgi:hypothetical protein
LIAEAKNLNASPENSLEESPDVQDIQVLQISTPVGDNDTPVQDNGEEIVETKDPKAEFKGKRKISPLVMKRVR